MSRPSTRFTLTPGLYKPGIIFEMRYPREVECCGQKFTKKAPNNRCPKCGSKNHPYKPGVPLP